jgi:ribosomal protein L7Ae-like RNA K-turn-binding protein
MEVEYSNSQIDYNEKSEEFLSKITENSKKIDEINKEFNLIKFINDNFTESDKYQIESIYFNQPRFNIIFGDVEHFPYKYIMAYLNYNLDNGNVMNGIKETIRSIELKKAKLVYIADDCDVKEYLDLIIRLCTENNIPFVKVLKWTNLRDLLFKGLTSRELEALAKEKNRELKIKPRCNSAVVLFNNEDNDKMNILKSQEDRDIIMQEN